MNIILPILSVVIGFAIAFYIKKETHAVQYLLSFSGAFLLSILVFEFLPHVYEDYSPAIGFFIMGGVLMQVLLEFMSKGLEHGHAHLDHKIESFPFLLFIGLCIHAFMEGFPISGNFHLLLGIVLHKIPVAIVIAILLLNSSLSNFKIYSFLILFAVMTPLGSLFNEYLVYSPQAEHYIEAVVVGILLHVSTTILFESSKNHQFNWTKITTILLGVGLAYLV